MCAMVSRVHNGFSLIYYQVLETMVHMTAQPGPRQFWKAYCKYFTKIIILQLLTAVFSGRIVMKLPFFEF